MKQAIHKIVQGDCLEVMKKMQDHGFIQTIKDRQAKAERGEGS